MRKRVIALYVFQLASMFFVIEAVAQRTVYTEVPTLKELITSALQKDYELRNKELDVTLTNVDRQKVKDSFLSFYKS